MILSELTDILGAPRNSRPSLRQWQSFVRWCSGIFAATTFPCVTEHFLRLAGAEITWASVGEPRDVAIVLDAISKLSRKELVSIHLSGNATCAWLAAFGNYCFGLGVEVPDPSEELLHQSAIYQEPRQAADIDVHRSVLDYEEAIHRIEPVCECAACNAQPASATTNMLCLTLVAESVIILLWALSSVSLIDICASLHIWCTTCIPRVGARTWRR